MSDLTYLDEGYNQYLSRELVSEFQDTGYLGDGFTDLAPTTSPSISGSLNPNQVSSGLPAGSVDFDKLTINRLGVTDYIQSVNYVAGSAGWRIDGDGDAEFNDGTFRGALSASTIDIGGSDATSFHVDIDGNMWLGAATFASGAFSVTNAGAATASSITITGGSITGTPIASIPNSTATDLSLLTLTHDIVFSASDADTVAWASGTITFSNGRTFSIDAGNTGTMAARTYIYLDTSASSTVLQTTTSPTTAHGANKVTLAVAINSTDKAEFLAYHGTGNRNILVDNLAANSTSTNEFVSNTAQIKNLIVTNAKINDLAVDKLTAGSITSKAITLAISEGTGDVKIQAGKTDFGDTTAGFILGMDDSASNVAKFEIGDASNSLNWNGSTLSITGTITSTSGTIGGWSLGSTTITGGSLTLDSTGNIRFGKTSFSDTTNAGLIMGLDSGTPKFYIGTASDASYVKLSGGIYDLVGSVSSRATSTLASAINSSGNLITDVINARIDSSAKNILSDFNFGSSDYAGGVKAGDLTWESSNGAIIGGSGVVVYRKGIVGAASGVATFSIDATTGAATFAGTLSAPSGTIGGWTIGASSLTAGSGSTTVGLDTSVTTGDDVRIYAGSSTASSAPFRVTESGVLYASNVNISGRITSTEGLLGSVSISSTGLSGGLIEGATIRSPIIETNANAPKIRMDTVGLYYQQTSSAGQYGEFKYGTSTKYGSGITATAFNTNYPPFSVLQEQTKADLRLYNRSADPASGTHAVGDLIVVSGKLKICTTAGTPGTFKVIPAATPQTGYTTFTNLSTDRTADANATTVEELADILGTLIEDLKATGIISA